MQKRKIAQRTCIITREKCDKKELVRIVRTPSGEVIVDLTGKTNGRGAYLKKELKVFEKAKKSGLLSKHLEVEVPQSVYEELEKLI